VIEPAAPLVASLEEFAELCGVTPETMRVHIREVGKDGQAAPAWLIERGERGRAYKIEAEGGIAWWRDKRERDDLADADRRGRLQQLRLDVVGDGSDGGEDLTLSGKQRREEYAAAMDALKYRKMLGQLVDRTLLERVLSSASVDLRRRLQQIPAEFGIAAGLPADDVKDLEGRIGRALDGFVSEISKPGAFEEQ